MLNGDYAEIDHGDLEISISASMPSVFAGQGRRTCRPENMILFTAAGLLRYGNKKDSKVRVASGDADAQVSKIWNSVISSS